MPKPLAAQAFRGGGKTTHIKENIYTKNDLCTTKVVFNCSWSYIKEVFIIPPLFNDGNINMQKMLYKKIQENMKNQEEINTTCHCEERIFAGGCKSIGKADCDTRLSAKTKKRSDVAVQSKKVGLSHIVTGLPHSRWSLAMTGRKI